MGRPGLMRHPKFLRLAQLLGSPALARGYLELIWDTAYESGEETIGSSVEVEAVAHWQGKPGRLAKLLIGSGFLDRVGRTELRVHDLWDHAPDYVWERAKREAARRARGKTLSEIRSEAGRRGAEKTNSTRRQTLGKREAFADTIPANAATPAPAPAPAPLTTTALSAAPTAIGFDTTLAESDSGPDHKAQRVFDHWRKVMSKNGTTILDRKRRRAVEARLRDGYTVEDLCLAVDGCAQTPHNMGENERGQRYDDLELICRNASQVDRFKANAVRPPRPWKDPRKGVSRAEDSESYFNNQKPGEIKL